MCWRRIGAGSGTFLSAAPTCHTALAPISVVTPSSVHCKETQKYVKLKDDYDTNEDHDDCDQYHDDLDNGVGDHR